MRRRQFGAGAIIASGDAGQVGQRWVVAHSAATIALIRKDGEAPLFDGLGTARAETSSAQAVTFTETPDAFGNSVATTGSTGNSYQFAATSGYRNDGDAGLVKVGARYYDPQVGSFTTRDTYLGQKPYIYCEHDLVNAVDPSGHFLFLIVILIIIILAGPGCSSPSPNPDPGPSQFPPKPDPIPGPENSTQPGGEFDGNPYFNPG